MARGADEPEAKTSFKNKNFFGGFFFKNDNFCEGKGAEYLAHFGRRQNASNQISRIFWWARSEVCQAYYARQDERFGLDKVRGRRVSEPVGWGFRDGFWVRQI